MQPEIRSFVSVLRSPVTPFDRSDEECEVFRRVQRILATESVNSAPFKRGVPERGANFWQGKV